jgi:hypothetical protein
MGMQIMKEHNRPEFMVTLLDRDKATALVKSRFKDPEGIHAQPMVVINGKDGLATVCTEGVGWVKDDKGLYTLLYFSNFSDGYIDITTDELHSLISDEQTNLGTFIRTFGSRLENNFDIWHYYGKDLDQTPSRVLVSN